MRTGAAALSLALIASACGGASGDTTTAEPAAPTETTVTETETTTDAGGPGLPQLAGTTVGGAQLDTNDLAGQDVVVWFWAPW